VYPIQITYRNLPPSAQLSARIRDLCEKLGHLHPRVQMCRVAVEQVAVRARSAVPKPYRVDVRLRIPTCEIVGPAEENVELDAALRRAFLLVRRQLRDIVAVERAASRERDAIRSAGASLRSAPAPRCSKDRAS
jgi:hypothetical protein